jgi:AcrR family transcriptional regulator
MSAPGLRERKKQATRAALADAAWNLAVERGVGAVTIDEIAQAADVSPRTFFNYFSSKEEAVLERTATVGQGLAAAIRERPADEPLADALYAAVEAVLLPVTMPVGGWLATLRRLRETSPELIPHQLAVWERMSTAIAEAVAERTGTDVERDQYPMLVTVWLLGAWRVSFERWPTQEPTSADVLQRMRAAIRQLVAGIAEPYDRPDR